MKKIKLFLAAMAAMVTMGVQAQSWTASEVGEGYFMLYNVGTGQYLTRGNGWGTQASITAASNAGNGIAVQLEAVGDDFKIRTNINGDGKGLEHLNGGTIYTDQSQGKNSTWTFTQVSTDNGPVYTIVSKDNHGGGAGVYLTAGANGTIVTPGTDGTIAGAQWKLMAIPAQPIGMSDASDTNPVDATSLIVNPNFSFDAIKKGEGWTMQSSNYNPCGGNVSGGDVIYNPCAESWRAAFTLSQTITVPNGIYELTAQAAVTEYDVTGADLPVVYANDVTTPFTAMTKGENSMGGVATNFTAGDYTVGPIRVVVTNGSLTIGVRGTRTNTWCVWDNFKLTYKGVDLSELKAALQAQINAIPTLEGTTTTAAYNAAKSYADGIDVDALTTEEAISNASTGLNNLVSAAKALQNAYAGYLVLRAVVEALDDDASIYSGDATIDISEIDAPIQATTTLDDLNAAIETAKPLLQNAAATFMSAVTLNDGKRFDITNIYLTNPDFEVATPSGSMPPGWNITITGQNLGQQNRTDTNPETGLAITNFIEAWHPSQLGDGVIAQTVSSLPEGTYVLECDASICHDPAGANDITGANLFIQSPLKTERQAISNVRLYINHYSLSFVHSGEGEVSFGLEANNTNANWLSADNFKVYFAGGIDYKAILDAAVAEFQGLESSIDATIFAEYAAIVAENDKTWSNKSEYQTAIAAVNKAIEDMQAANTALKNAKSDYDAALDAATTARDAQANKNVTGAERTALNNAIADTPEANTDSYSAKTDALTNATATFTAAAASYDAYVSYRAETVTLFGEELAASAVATAPTTAAEAAAGVHALNIAQYNKVASEYPYSLTSKIGDFSTWTGTAEVGTPRAAGTPNSLDWEHWSGVTHPYYEQDGSGYNNEGGWTIKYTKTTTLPAGSYVVKVAARSSAGVTSSVSVKDDKDASLAPTISLPCTGNRARGISKDGKASWSDSDEFILENQGGGWEWRFVPFTLAAETEVTMTFYAEASSQYQWMSIGDGELLSATNIATAVAYDENADNTITNEDVANVTMTRKIKEGYNTVVLPFDCTLGQVEAAFGTGTEVYAFSESSENANDVTINFNKVAAGTISANVPVLIKATQASASQTFNGVQVVAPTEGAIVQGTNTKFIGVFGPLTISAGDYFVGNGAIYKSTGATNMKAFRAYIYAQEASNVKMFVDGIETGIDEINGADVENGAIYNLAGQRVNKAQKGVFIVNGKKVIVK